MYNKPSFNDENVWYILWKPYLVNFMIKTRLWGTDLKSSQWQALYEGPALHDIFKTEFFLSESFFCVFFLKTIK